jgi:hypothetical protein
MKLEKATKGIALRIDQLGSVLDAESEIGRIVSLANPDEVIPGTGSNMLDKAPKDHPRDGTPPAHGFPSRPIPC